MSVTCSRTAQGTATKLGVWVEKQPQKHLKLRNIHQQDECSSCNTVTQNCLMGMND